MSEAVGTGIVAAVLAVILGTIAVKLIRDKKKGKSSCGCGCSSCPAGSACHSKKK